MTTRLLRRTAEAVGWILLSACACLAFDGEANDELNRALEEIKAAAEMIDDRASTAAALQGQLQVQADALAVEIRQERRRLGADSFQQALQINRTRYDLLLLQHLAGYLFQLEEHRACLRSAANTLSAYRDRVRDDRLVLQALNGLDSGELLQQVRAAVGEYRRQCGAPLLKARTARGPGELEMLWNDSVKPH
jgi:hypothetical protein